MYAETVAHTFFDNKRKKTYGVTGALLARDVLEDLLGGDAAAVGGELRRVQQLVHPLHALAVSRLFHLQACDFPQSATIHTPFLAQTTKQKKGQWPNAQREIYTHTGANTCVQTDTPSALGCTHASVQASVNAQRLITQEDPANCQKYTRLAIS